MFYENTERNHKKEDHSFKEGHIHTSSMSEEDGEITDSLVLKLPQRHLNQSHKSRDSPKHLHHKKSKRHKSKRSRDDREKHELRKQLRTTRHSELDLQEKGRYYNDQMHYKENYKKIQHTNEQTHATHNSEVYRRYKHAEGHFQKGSDELYGFIENTSSKKFKKTHLRKYRNRSNEDYYNIDKSINREDKNSKETDTGDSVLQDDVEMCVKETGSYSEDDRSSIENREDKVMKNKRLEDMDVTKRLSEHLYSDHYLRKKSKREEKEDLNKPHHQTDTVTISDNSENDIGTDAEFESFLSDASNDRKKSSECTESIHSTENLNQKETTRKWYEDSPEESHFQFIKDYGGTDDDDVQEELNQLNDDDLPEDLPPYYPAIHGCRSANEFQLLNHVEEGTYGVVYRARDKQSNDIVALKRLKMEREREGFPITSLREINTLLKGQHPNVVTVREIVVGNGFDKIYIVMDFVEHDLKSLMASMREKKQTFNISEIKCLLKQLLCAMAYLHDNWILHRDLKTSNLLLSDKGILKVGDFGLAREYGSPLKAYTSVVVTLWYRAPELLLCTKKYSTPIDVWSVGCIFAELLLMKPVFPGKSEVDQINRIFKTLGTPNQEIWPDFNKLPAVQRMNFTQHPMSNLRSRFYILSVIGLSLLQRLLTYDPSQRITAEKALEHPYFSETPLPADPSMLSTWLSKDELKQHEVRGEYGQFIESNGGTNMFSLHGNGDITVPENGRPSMEDGFTLKF